MGILFSGRNSTCYVRDWVGYIVSLCLILFGIVSITVINVYQEEIKDEVYDVQPVNSLLPEAENLCKQQRKNKGKKYIWNSKAKVSIVANQAKTYLSFCYMKQLRFMGWDASPSINLWLPIHIHLDGEGHDVRVKCLVQCPRHRSRDECTNHKCHLQLC